MKFIIFEDDNFNDFYPLSLTRPLWELRSGIYSFRERLIIFIKTNFEVSSQVHYFTRDYLVPYYKEKYPEMSINDHSIFSGHDDIFFINGTIYPDNSLCDLGPNTILMDKGALLAARISASSCNANLRTPAAIVREAAAGASIVTLEEKKCALSYPVYIWDLMLKNSRRIIDDYTIFLILHPHSCSNHVTIIGDPTQVYISGSAVIDPFVVIDSTKGPVVIDERTRVHSFTKIEGPAYIGEDCVILGPKVRCGCSIGPHCRIGGEVEETIFQGYSNKYHDGFIGHSYIGEWVNMGALTTNSDLKNNYSKIKVYIPDGRKMTDSMKIGCFMGDFVKTSIGTLINTGTSIGPGAMLVSNGTLTPAHIPPFAWFLNGTLSSIDWWNEFLNASREMTSRRGARFSEAYMQIFKILFADKNSYSERGRG
jgi:UDP-N-acetylglucosamine diphosphorylase/glucosamine-1-phosphate N-acetyltransferase